MGGRASALCYNRLLLRTWGTELDAQNLGHIGVRQLF